MIRLSGKLLIASGLIFCGLAVFQIHGNLSRQTDIPITKTQTSTRFPILKEGFLTTKELHPLIALNSASTKDSTLINESKIESTLKTFITNRIKDAFAEKGMNFQKLNGRIFYSIKPRSIALLVEWTNSQLIPQKIYFDEFLLSF